MSTVVDRFDDPCDPLDVAARLAGRRHRVLLHSGRDDDGCGRWSFVGCDPVRTIEARGDEIVVRDRAGRIDRQFIGDPLGALDELVGVAGVASPVAGDPRPHPIAVGYLSYDLGRRAVGLRRRRGLAVAELWFGIYPALWRMDHATGARELIGDQAAVAELRHALATESHRAKIQAAESEVWIGPLRDPDPRSLYERRHERILEYIRAGDVYQVNLARRLVAPVIRAGDGLALYAAASAAAPAAYGAYLEAGPIKVLSMSPERFLSRAPWSERLETRPIKGTRRRTGVAALDHAARADLARDDKERAEHLMIVDLERNDLGKVAEIGSVKVESLGRIVELPTLFHAVTTVCCRLRRGVTVSEILRATFPGGSITGAPKRRAMEIIDELEPSPRGVYTGAIGYIGAGGALELSIAIRTTVIAGNELSLGVGGGIVADSCAAREREETEEKVASWRRALAPFIAARAGR